MGLVAAQDGCVFGLEISTRVPGFAEELELVASNQGCEAPSLESLADS